MMVKSHMAKAIPHAERLLIVRQHEAGKSLRQLSEELGYSYDGVRKIYRQYRRDGLAGIALKYHHCRRPTVYRGKIWEQVRSMIEANPKWGAPYIRSQLLAQGQVERVPHERTIQRWLKAQGLAKGRGRKARVDRSYTQQVHDTWQVDGKENVSLAEAQQTCYLSIADEGSRTFLQGQVFPPAQPDASGASARSSTSHDSSLP